MFNIKIYNNNVCVASTSKAFAENIKKELMREYTFTFSVANNNNARQYLLPNSIIEVDGQKFDLASIKQSSGTTNKTDILANHVGYRLSNYIIPIGYAFVGTPAEILQDILDVAVDNNGNKASTEFTVGICADVGIKSFELQNSQETTARAAILALTKIGVEVDFNSFSIDLPIVCGTGNVKTFEFGVDLCDFERSWDANNGWTYNVKIANLQRVPGHEGDIFANGDICTIKDKFIGDEVTQRIIRYNKCGDPTQDSITIGLFAYDLTDINIETSKKIKSSVQQGEQYSNVSIDHTDGFKAVNLADNLRVVMNADDCFAVQAKQNEQWETVTSAELWGLISPRLTTQEAKDSFYATVGKTEDGEDSFKLYRIIDGSIKKIFEVWDVDGSTVVSPGSNSSIAFKSQNLPWFWEDGGVAIGYTGTINYYDGILEHTMTIKNGIVISDE